MEKKVITIFLNLLVILTLIFIFNFSDANAHKKKNHKPMICILEEDRSESEKSWCNQLLYFHRLCKLDQDCAILKLNE